MMTPRRLVETWVSRFNAGDAAGLAELYHEDAVNHQVTQAPVEGRDAIRAMFEAEFARAAMTCIVEAIHEAGEVIALEWRDPITGPPGPWEPASLRAILLPDGRWCAG